MKKLLVFGDVHLSAINSWSYEAGEFFIDWFKNEKFGKKEDIEVAFDGDIAERDTNPGNVVEQMDRLFTIASEKFNHVYICMGNHDLKKYHDVEQHSLKFLGNKPNTDVIENECEIITPNGFSILFLPWKRIDNMSIGDYYNTKLPQEMYQKSYDAVVGHWNIKEEKGLMWMKEGVDINLFHSKMFAIGHIHNRVRDEYVGSIFPNNISEQDGKPRGYKVLDENRNESFCPMPTFLEYITIKYGDPVPERKPNCAYSYIISDCESVAQAKEKYSDLKIRSIERSPTSLKGKLEIGTDKKDGIGINILTGSPLIALDEMIKENDLKLSRKTYNLVKTLLTPKSE